LRHFVFANSESHWYSLLFILYFACGFHHPPPPQRAFDSEQRHTPRWGDLSGLSNSIGLAADDPIKRAIALEPGNPEYPDQAASSAATDRSEEALALARRAVELDPLNASSWEVRGEIRYFEGQLVGAEADVKKSLELSPDVWPGPVRFSQIYVMEGRRPLDALPEIKRVRSDSRRKYLYAVKYAAIDREKQ
jgi:tetratricopeptide (TPR) repeat protein